GWYELIDGKVRTRKNGLNDLGEVQPPRLHIHADGIAITGLPQSAIDWLLKSIEYQTTHNDAGDDAEPTAKTISLTIRAG
ncbi:hypothetical protein AAER27_23325, partial [Pseudomonas aeruginosa]